MPPPSSRLRSVIQRRTVMASLCGHQRDWDPAKSSRSKVVAIALATSCAVGDERPTIPPAPLIFRRLRRSPSLAIYPLWSTMYSELELLARRRPHASAKTQEQEKSAQGR